jgi:trigger factor
MQAERKLDKDQLASLSSQRSVQEYLEDEKENINRIIKQMLAVGEIFKSENLQVTKTLGFVFLAWLIII